MRAVDDVERDMLGASRSIWFEYDADDCHVEVVAAKVGHIPPKTYIFDCDAFVWTIVEKLSALERKSAPGRAADVTSLAVVVFCCSHVPLPLLLVFEGVNLHIEELVEVEHEPA